MSRNYSVSRIGAFDQCQLKYKFAYIDELRRETDTIEAFMGSRVHDALKSLYDFIKNKVIKPRDWLLATYEDFWKKNYTDSVKIVKKDYTAADYFEKGRKSLADFYETHHPFDQAKVVKTEEPIYFTVKHASLEYPFTGVLDRIDWNDREKIFEIHDYKTSGTLMTQEDADQDWQLGLYHLALLSKWPEAEKTKLVWHFLVFNKQIESWRRREELDKLQETVVQRIQEIERAKDFPPAKSALCDWCAFQDICPLWAHPKKMEALEVNAYLKDPGVKLVARYAELEEEKSLFKEKIKAIEEEQSKVEEAALAFAEKEKIKVIDGPDHQLLVTIKDEFCAPTRNEDQMKWQQLRDLLIQENRYLEVSTVNSMMLNNRLRNWPQEMMAKVKSYLIKRSVRKVDLRRKTR